MAQASESVAIYWDFENLHANLVDQAHGQGAYLANRFRPQDEVIDVETIVEYALSLGPIAINRAFANWVSFNRYKQSLLQAAIELIQVFPPGANAKNGADIKLCLDVMEDMVRFPHIGTIIVVGGDSDYMPLSYKVKAAGRTLVGIGSRRGTNQHWARSCHEFKFYEALLAPSLPAPEAAASGQPPAGSMPPAAVGEPVVTPAQRVAAAAEPPGVPAEAAARLEEMRTLLDVAEAAAAQRKAARDLVGKAVARLAQNRGETWIQKARLSAPRAGLRPARPPRGSSKVAEPHLLESIPGPLAAPDVRCRNTSRYQNIKDLATLFLVRPFIQRIDSTFHESSYGFSTFNELLASMSDLVEVRRGEFDHELRLRPVVSEPAS